MTRRVRFVAFAGVVMAGGCASGAGEIVPGTASLPSGKRAPPPAPGNTAQATPRSRPFPRTLDPIPPLYTPSARDLPLQPILVAPRAEAHEPLRSRPPYPDPFGPDNPLRRIDPLTGRDPLGRFDSTFVVGSVAAHRVRGTASRHPASGTHPDHRRYRGTG